MGARTKLNSAYFLGSLLIAAMIGLLLDQSWKICGIAMLVLLLLNAHAGNIRIRR